MSERMPLLAANWKMHKTKSEMQAFVQEFASLSEEVPNREILICPPFTLLEPLYQCLSDVSKIAIGGQNLWIEDQGAFTGEISGVMLKDIGCNYVIVGHSERRQLFAEDDVLVARKLEAAVNADLVPILCVGETLTEREQGQATNRVKKQLEAGLSIFPARCELVIAYEPVWAIGTGLTAHTVDAQEMCAFIRRRLSIIFTEEKALATRILYGGSVKPANIGELMAQPDIDGVLVGGSGLNAQEFSHIVRFDDEQ